MAFNNYLLKLGSGTSKAEFPMSYINENSYKVSPEQRTDLDSGMDDTVGELHRTVLPHYRTKIEIETLPNLTNVEVENLMSFIRNRYIDVKQQKVEIDYFSQKTNSYYTGNAYLVDTTFPLKRWDKTHGILLYDSFKITFIQY